MVFVAENQGGKPAALLVRVSSCYRLAQWKDIQREFLELLWSFENETVPDFRGRKEFLEGERAFTLLPRCAGEPPRASGANHAPLVVCSCCDHHDRHYSGSHAVPTGARSACQLPHSSVPGIPARGHPATAGDAGRTLPCSVSSPLSHAAARTPGLP